jgi:hypothetical protein
VGLPSRRNDVFNWGDPDPFWLNVTNAALGLATLVLVLAIGWSVAAELVRKHRHGHHHTHVAR